MPKDSAHPWWLAARPHTLFAAIVPVLVGAGSALGHSVFRADAFAGALIGALAIQVAANFANDASDAKRGADTPDRIGPTRAVAAGLLSSRQIWRATWIAFGVAAAAGIYLTSITSPVILVVGAVSILAAIGYVGGPAPYGYRGFGEIFVFIFFGLVATVTSRYVHDQTAPLDVWLMAIPIGFLVTAILVANNVRDIDTDARVGKRTLAVIIGRRRATWLYAGLVYGTFGLIAAFSFADLIPGVGLLALLALPLAVPLTRRLAATTDGPSLIQVLKGTARLHLLVGIALTFGASLGATVS